MTYDIPPLRPIDDMLPIKTQDDLCQLWRSLMGPLGFGRHRLWIVTMGADGHVLPGLIQVDECPIEPDRVVLGHLMERLLELFDEDPWRHSVAFLWSRPGSSATNPSDRAWAHAIREAVDRALIPAWPVHLANDFDLRVFAPDELVV